MNGLITAVLLSAFAAISLVLYCCVCIRTPYDREIDDKEQQKFLKQQQNKAADKKSGF